MLYKLYCFKSDFVAFILSEDEQLRNWARYDLLPNDVFAIIDIIDEGKPTDYSRSVKIYRFRDGATGWTSLAWIMQGSDMIETEFNI